MPGLVVGSRWDILAWNRAAEVLFGGLAALPEERRNVLWLIFGNPLLSGMIEDWPTQARAILAQFRLSWARHLHQPSFSDLIDELSAASPELAAWWAEHDVRPRLSRRRSYVHPTAGPLEIDLHVFRVHDGSELWQVVFAPVPGTGTRERLRRLIDEQSIGLLAILSLAPLMLAPLG